MRSKMYSRISQYLRRDDRLVSRFCTDKAERKQTVSTFREGMKRHSKKFVFTGLLVVIPSSIYAIYRLRGEPVPTVK